MNRTGSAGGPAPLFNGVNLTLITIAFNHVHNKTTTTIRVGGSTRALKFDN